MTDATYHVVTVGGRRSVSAFLLGAVEDAAKLERRDPAAVVTAKAAVVLAGDIHTTAWQWKDNVKPTWYVYATQAALDVDLQRGPITGASPGWFARIEEAA